MLASSLDYPLDIFDFDNRFVRELPADAEAENFRRQVYGACYSRVEPLRVSSPRLVAYSREVAEQLDLSESVCESEDFCQVFVGNRLASGMDPFACCYGGHQFGHWAGQLGDGRAINLGEIVSRRGQHLTLQLKGAGPTPYSRGADGLAVLRSSIREFLCSEAMYHLGVPTTRALSVILTGEQVMRDMFYDGHPQYESGAVVCRVAPSFTRFGSFQIFAARDDLQTLKKLADYTICADFPHLDASGAQLYLQWFADVCKRTADLILHWQRVGFVHGVMNTDNMSILGLTIDYGPYGWLENYDPDWTPNVTDAYGRRYRFGNQPIIAYWNLVQFANAIFPLVKHAELLQQTLKTFTSQYEQGWLTIMSAKLGLSAVSQERNETLIADALTLMNSAETDMTLFYRGLADIDSSWDGKDFCEWLEGCSYKALTEENRTQAEDWYKIYRECLSRDSRSDDERRTAMNAVNPRYVLRNYLAQQAIDKAEQGDFGMVVELLDVLRYPYSEQQDKQHFAAKRPEWAKHRPGCSMLSCSS